MTFSRAARVAPEELVSSVRRPAAHPSLNASSLETHVDTRTYSEKLRDPRWQRKRLEVLQRENFKCQHCYAADKTLNVHHTIYRKGAAPWEYEDRLLMVLCEDCHRNWHSHSDRLREAVGLLSAYDCELMLGFARALCALRAGDGGAPFGFAITAGHPELSGVAAALFCEYGSAQLAGESFAQFLSIGDMGWREILAFGAALGTRIHSEWKEKFELRYAEELAIVDEIIPKAEG